MNIISIVNAPTVKRQYGAMRLIVGPHSAETMKTVRVDIKILEINPADHTSKHYHLESDSVFWVIEGEVELETLEQSARVKLGDVALVPAGEFHMLRNITANPCKVLEIMSPPYEKKDLYYK